MNDRKLTKIRTETRFAELARTGELIFHAKDLANLWNIVQPNTLHTTIKRYVQKRLLFRIYKGMYALKPVDQLDPWLLGTKALHSYAYMSCETVLSHAGVMQQHVPTITFVSSSSRTFRIGPHQFRSRKLADRYLFNPAGVSDRHGIRSASPERAVADMLYFNPKTHFDGAAGINWQTVKKIQKEVGYPVDPRI